ncbi:MAG: histone deacetylase family protein [Burkholderiaceae bacterium]
MTLAYITHPSSLKHSMGEHHPECPERLAAIHDRLLSDGLLDLMDAQDAPAATREQLLAAHAAEHVDLVERTAPASGMARIDADTAMNPATLHAARHAAGAVVAAVDHVMQAPGFRAFAAVRPPGHHAQRNRAMGFCFFNNIAVGAAHAIATYGLERVAIIDFDVHHGNGTEDIFADHPNVLMCSTFERDLYPFCGEEPLGANMINVPLAARSDGKALREAVVQHWLPALDAYKPQLVMISAGFDAHRADDLGRLAWTENDYRWVTHVLAQVAAKHSQGRVVSSLEGGYDLHALAASVAQHIRVLLQIDPPPPDLPSL